MKMKNDTKFEEELTCQFKIARMFPILTSRDRQMNTFTIVNITPTYKKQSMGQVYASSIPKRPYFSLQFSQEQKIIGHSFERGAY